MTGQSRGARSRRGGGVPGWPLLTALLVLAIAASSTLVFTDRVELLRLAVILSLWAAVVAAFVTVVYRRQSELDQAKARDMKFVYDLQLDREVSARREYELSVEAHLRRQLARELRAQAADEMSALRSELMSLRTQLEALLGTDLGERPALGSDRLAVPMPAAPGRVESSRVTVVTEEVVAIAAATETVVESPIIDVPEEPLTPPEPPPAEPRYPARDYRGNHRRPAEGRSAPPPPPARPAPPTPPPARPAPPTPPPARPAAPPPSEPAVVRPGPAVGAARQPEAPWRPPEVRRGRPATGDAGWRPPRSESVAAPDKPRGRHWVPPDEQPGPAGRHRGFGEQSAPQPPPAPEPTAAPEPAPAPESQGQHTGGQSVADLMARLQVNGPGGGGGRRRRED